MARRCKRETQRAEKFRKRRGNLLKKANELAWMTEAKVYIVLQERGKFYTYKSTEDQHWPPSEDTIVSHSGNALIRFMAKCDRKCTV